MSKKDLRKERDELKERAEVTAKELEMLASDIEHAIRELPRFTTKPQTVALLQHQADRAQALAEGLSVEARNPGPADREILGYLYKVRVELGLALLLVLRPIATGALEEVGATGVHALPQVQALTAKAEEMSGTKAITPASVRAEEKVPGPSSSDDPASMLVQAEAMIAQTMKKAGAEWSLHRRSLDGGVDLVLTVVEDNDTIEKVARGVAQSSRTLYSVEVEVDFVAPQQHASPRTSADKVEVVVRYDDQPERIEEWSRGTAATDVVVMEDRPFSKFKRFKLDSQGRPIFVEVTPLPEDEP